jgi:hypothetical protein
MNAPRQVDTEHGAPSVEAVFKERRTVDDTGVVHKDVEAAEALKCSCHRSICRRFVGDVQTLENSFVSPNRLGDFTSILLVDIGDDDGSTVIRKPLDNCTSDPRRPASDNRDLMLKLCLHTNALLSPREESIKGCLQPRHQE